MPVAATVVGDHRVPTRGVLETRDVPAEIAEAHWHDMLNILPPVGWRHDSNGESFKMSERTTGAITAIYVQINGRYFSFSDDIRTPDDPDTGRA